MIQLQYDLPARKWDAGKRVCRVEQTMLFLAHRILLKHFFHGRIDLVYKLSPLAR